MQRPTSVTVFAVLNMVFSVLGAIGLASMAAVLFAMPELPDAPDVAFMPRGWTVFRMVCGVVGAIVLFISGIGLLGMRSWGRVAAIWYAIAMVVLTALDLAIIWFYVVQPALALVDGPAPEAVGASIGGLFGGCIGLIYPLLLWYFMTRPHVVAAFDGISAEPVESSWATTIPPAPNAADSSNPYVSPRTESGTAPPMSESIVETFVPSKNGPALAAYYLGLLSLLPCLGFPIGIAAVYFGLKGLRRVRENPEVRGGAHAWVGVILGSLFGLFNLALVVLLILGGIAAAVAP